MRRKSKRSSFDQLTEMPRSENKSLKSVGYAEKSELQDLNKTLESCLGDMAQLEEETKEFEKRIQEMEASAEAQVKKATITLDRKNTKLKNEHRAQTVALDHLKADQADKEREIELLMAKRDSEAAKIADAEAEYEVLQREIAQIGQQIPDLRKELAAKRKSNAELRKSLKSLEGSLSAANADLTKKTADAEALGKKVDALKDRLEVITTDGQESEQRHKLVIQRLSDLLAGGPGDLEGEWQSLKEALREEHEQELETLTQEKTEKWKFELNKMDNKIGAAMDRVKDANDRIGAARNDLHAMIADRDGLLNDLAGLRLRLEEESQNEAYLPGSLDALIKMYEDMLAKKDAECKRMAAANTALEKSNAKLEDALEELKAKVAEARLALAQEKVLYYKALENISNCDDRMEAEENDLKEILDQLRLSIEGRAVLTKELNEEIAELRQLELDIAGLRAEINKYSDLLNYVPDPKKSTPKRDAKRRRTETTVTTTTTGASSATKKTKVTKTTTKTSTTKTSAKKTVAPAVEEEEGDAMDLNDDGRITRSEARVFKGDESARAHTNRAGGDSANAGEIVIEDDLINDEGYTLLANLSNSAVDISGWKIKARIGHIQHRFAKGTVMQPGANVYIWAKTSDNKKGKGNCVWKSREQTKGDDTDILELYDAEGKVVHRYSTA